MKYFILYALVCSVVGILLLVVTRQIVPFNMERLGDQAAVEPADQLDKLVVRSTREPESGHPAPGPTGQPVPGVADQPAPGATGQPVPGATAKLSSHAPAVSTDQWDLRPTDEPTVRKGGRVGTTAQ